MTFYETASVAAISAGISSVLSAIATWAIAARGRKAQERVYIENEIAQMIDLSMRYPFVEDDEFCRQWAGMDEHSDRALQYDNYCCFVFNLIDRIWRHTGGKPSRVLAILAVPELAVRHQVWWKSTQEKKEGYPDGEFRQFIDACIKGAYKRGEKK